MRRVLAVLTAVLLLAGCSHNEPLSLHGAASLRVDIDVYKGPLTTSFPGQVGELVGVLSSSIHSVWDWRDEAQLLRVQLKCPSGRYDARGRWTQDCLMLVRAIETSEDILDASCYILEAPTLQVTIGRAVNVAMGTCRTYDREKADARAQRGISPFELPAEKARYGLTDADLYRLWQAPGEVGLADAIADISANKPELPREVILNLAQRLRSDRAADRIWLRNEADACRSRGDATNQLMCQGDVIVIAFNTFAKTLDEAAGRVARDSLAHPARDARVRSLAVQYAEIASTYGSQIHARITVLQHQASLPPGASSTDRALLPRDPRTLPLSDFLRGAKPTDYTRLFKWLETAPTYSADTRIHIAERLSGDGYWENVNTAYASGQGETTQAFVLDERGNWGLKSFSNDPTDLLAAYRKVTDAALKTAANLALKAGTGPAGTAASRISDATRAANFANQLATGEVPATPGLIAGLDVKRLRQDVADSLKRQKDYYTEMQARLEREQTAAATDAATAKTNAEAAKGAADQADTDFKAETLRRDSLQAQLLTALKLLSDAQQSDGGDVTAAQSAVTTAQDQIVASATELGRLKGVAAVQQGKYETAEKERSEKQAQADSLKQRASELPREAIEAARSTVRNYQSLIASLESGIASASQPAPAPEKPPTLPTPVGQ